MRRLGLVVAVACGVQLAWLTAGCRVEPAVPEPPAPPPPAGPMVLVPRSCMTVPEALTVAHLQVGLRYAAPNGSLRGVVGPYPAGKSMPLDDLVADVANVAGLRVVPNPQAVVFASQADPQTVATLIADLSGLDVAKRRQAAFELGRSGALEAVAPLMAAVADSDESASFHALMALADLERDFVAPARYPGRVSLITLFGANAAQAGQDALLYIIGEHPDQGGPTWLAAVSVASRAQLPGVTPLLMKVLADRRRIPRGDDRPVRAAAWAFSQYKDPAPVEPLADLLTATDVGYDLAREAAVALGRINLAASMQALIQASGDERATVRRAAAEGLGYCQNRVQAIETLRQMLKDSDEATVALSAEALARLNSAGSLALLGATLVAEVPTPVRIASAMALGQTAQAEARQDLLAAKSAEPPVVRAAVAEAIGRIGGPGAEGALLGLIGDANVEVRAAAAKALGRLGTLNSVLAATTVLNNRDEPMEVLLAAVDGLGESHQAPEAVAELERTAAAPAAFGRLRDAAVVALGRNATPAAQAVLRKLIPSAPATGSAERDLALRYYAPPADAQTVQLFIRALQGGNRAQKAYAANRLGEMADAAGLAQMILRFDEWDPCVRSAIVLGTLNSDGSMVVPALLAELSSRRASVRRAAALALGNHRDPRAVEALLTLSRDPDPTVRFAAVQGLGLIGDPGATDRLIEIALNEPAKLPADAAVRALRWRYFVWRPAVRSAFDKIRGTGRDCGVPPAPGAARSDEPGWQLLAWASDPQDPTMRAAGCGGSASVKLVSPPAVQVCCVRGRRVGSPQLGRCWALAPGMDRWIDVGEDPHSGPDPAGEWRFARRGLLAYPPFRATGDPVIPVAGVSEADAPWPEVRVVAPAVGETDAPGPLQVVTRSGQGNETPLPAGAGPRPALRDFTCRYGPELGYVVVNGGSASAQTGTFAALETWIYRVHEPVEIPAVPEGPVVYRRPVASVLGNGRVLLTWRAMPDAIDHDIYRAAVDVRLLWQDNPHQKIGAFAKVNASPIATTRYEDSVEALRGAAADTDRPAPVFAYKVVSRMADGGRVESDVTLTLADAPADLEAIERDDGSTLLLWQPGAQEALRGYLVYRQDVFSDAGVVRQNASPDALPVFIDWRDWPRADRRRYYVVPVDYLGQLGIPSAGAWSHGLP